MLVMAFSIFCIVDIVFPRDFLGELHVGSPVFQIPWLFWLFIQLGVHDCLPVQFLRVSALAAMLVAVVLRLHVVGQTLVE